MATMAGDVKVEVVSTGGLPSVKAIYPEDFVPFSRRMPSTTDPASDGMEVTEQDFLRALAAEIAPVLRQPYEYTISEILKAVQDVTPPGQPLPTRGSLKNQLDALVEDNVLSSRKGFFDTGDGQPRREQWAYTILNAAGRKPEDLFPNGWLAVKGPP